MQPNQHCDRCNDNPNQEVRIKIFANGQPQYCQQCKDCGARVSSWLSKSHPAVLAQTERVYFDEVAEDEHREARQREWREQAELRRQAIAPATQAAPSVNYYQYLASKEWWARRELVMKRAGGICEGCGTARAVDVHHMTYQHLGAEFLWELRAVCRACHARFHGKDEQRSGS